MNHEKGSLAFFLFVFGFVIAFFHIMPTLIPGFLKNPVSWGDALDFLTPFSVIPVAFFLFTRIRRETEDNRGSSPFFGKMAGVVLGFGFLLYVDGHGLHLSANSIARLLDGQKGSDLFKAVYVYDEVISHYMWDSGVFLISLGLILAATALPREKSFSGASLVFLLLGAALYGFTFTVSGIEGQTVPLTFPAAAAGTLLCGFLYLKNRQKNRQNPLFLFFAVGYLVSALLFAYWGITRPGFPEFSALGWI